MVNQHGKAFEDKLRRAAKRLGWYVLRLPTPTSYYTLRMPADFVLFTPKTTILAECKATRQTKLKPSSIRQYDKLQEFAAHKTQGIAVVIADFIDSYGLHSYCYTTADEMDSVVLKKEDGTEFLLDLLLKIEKEAICK